MEMRTRSTSFILIIALTLLACDASQTLSFGSAATPAAADNFTTYVVKPGDTFSKIAAQYNLTVEQLIALNSDRYPSLARDPSSLQVGWQLRIPSRPQTGAARTTGTAEASTLRLDLNETAQQIVDGINVARAGRKLSLLRVDAALSRIANDRSADMINRNYFSHVDPQTGQEPFLRYLQATGYAYQYAGENIAEIRNDAGWVPPLLTVASRYSASDLSGEFVRGWLNSNEHRLNIFNDKYRRTGVALAVSSDGRRIVATQVFSD
jgi:uncharacterized protein YkwD